jgi:hypothetical protein
MSYIATSIVLSSTSCGELPADTSKLIAGQVFFDGSSSSMKVFDGHAFRTIQINTHALLDYNSDSAIDWAQRQKNNYDGDDLWANANKHPLIMEALQQLDVAIALCKNLENE